MRYGRRFLFFLALSGALSILGSVHAEFHGGSSGGGGGSREVEDYLRTRSLVATLMAQEGPGIELKAGQATLDRARLLRAAKTELHVSALSGVGVTGKAMARGGSVILDIPHWDSEPEFGHTESVVRDILAIAGYPTALSRELTSYLYWRRFMEELPAGVPFVGTVRLAADACRNGSAEDAKMAALSDAIDRCLQAHYNLESCSAGWQRFESRLEPGPGLHDSWLCVARGAVIVAGQSGMRR